MGCVVFLPPVGGATSGPLSGLFHGRGRGHRTSARFLKANCSSATVSHPYGEMHHASSGLHVNDGRHDHSGRRRIGGEKNADEQGENYRYLEGDWDGSEGRDRVWRFHIQTRWEVHLG